MIEELETFVELQEFITMVDAETLANNALREMLTLTADILRYVHDKASAGDLGTF